MASHVLIDRDSTRKFIEARPSCAPQNPASRARGCRNPAPIATGLHACYGRYISRIQIPQILKPLLKLESLRAAGAPEYDGTFPGTLRVAAGS